jgi:NAD(P)H-hydrate epimerase
MRAVDRWAIDERGVEGLELMERAGGAVARAVEELAPDGPLTVFCGKGNNGRATTAATGWSSRGSYGAGPGR